MWQFKRTCTLCNLCSVLTAFPFQNVTWQQRANEEVGVEDGLEQTDPMKGKMFYRRSSNWQPFFGASDWGKGICLSTLGVCVARIALSVGQKHQWGRMRERSMVVSGCHEQHYGSLLLVLASIPACSVVFVERSKL